MNKSRNGKIARLPREIRRVARPFCKIAGGGLEDEGWGVALIREQLNRST